MTIIHKIMHCTVLQFMLGLDSGQTSEIDSEHENPCIKNMWRTVANSTLYTEDLLKGNQIHLLEKGSTSCLSDKNNPIQ